MNGTGTPIQVYKALANVRKEEAFLYNKLTYVLTDDTIISYYRSAIGEQAYLVVINFGTATSTVNYNVDPVNTESGEIIVSTENFSSDKYSVNKNVDLKALKLEPQQGLVIKLR
jgi:hypothetical protein